MTAREFIKKVKISQKLIMKTENKLDRLHSMEFSQV